MKQVKYIDYFQIFYPNVTLQQAAKIEDLFKTSIENPVQWNDDGLYVTVNLGNATPIHNMVLDKLRELGKVF